MRLKTLKWARGLRASLREEIDSLVSSGVADSQTLERVVNFRKQLQQVESLVDALEAQFPEVVEDHETAEPGDDS